MSFQSDSLMMTTSEEPNYQDNEIDDTLDAKDDKNDWYYKDCTMQEYEVMKVRNKFSEFFRFPVSHFTIVWKL